MHENAQAIESTASPATPSATRADRLRPRVPARLRSPLRRAGWPYRLATSSGRAMPGLIIIGAQRAGTTTLYSQLSANPAIGRSYVKEVHYFDANYERGVGWYRAHFEPRRRNTLALEASPYYLAHPLVPHRVRGLLPDVRLVALLRNPVERAISHYHLSVRKGDETLSLAEAIEREPERLEGEQETLLRAPLHRSYNHRHFSYLARGRYAEQLERWLAVFPRDQLLVLDSADLLTEPDRTLRRVCDFAGVPSRPVASGRIRPAKPYDDTPERERLRAYFAPHNERLWELLGEEFRWE